MTTAAGWLRKAESDLTPITLSLRPITLCYHQISELGGADDTRYRN
ncbi:hypothetical protein [Trichothermofontia sp.]